MMTMATRSMNPVINAVVYALVVLGCVTRKNAALLLCMTSVELTKDERRLVLEHFPEECAGWHPGVPCGPTCKVAKPDGWEGSDCMLRSVATVDSKHVCCGETWPNHTAECPERTCPEHGTAEAPATTLSGQTLWADYHKCDCGAEPAAPCLYHGIVRAAPHTGRPQAHRYVPGSGICCYACTSRAGKLETGGAWRCSSCDTLAQVNDLHLIPGVTS